ncbi:MAG: multidrug transporter, partial [Paracoccaceae bacterium]
MTEWIISLEGTEAGSRFAMGLAISAAFLHAVFGALQKGRHDPWLARGAIDFGYFTMAAPVAFFILPWPEPALWPVFGWMFVIHLIYKLLQGHAYTRGAYTVVYPIVRGSAPL